MKVIRWLILKVIIILEHIWLFVALIPLFIGIIMIDILLRLFKVDKVYLLITDFSAWCVLISEHLKNMKNNLGETIHYV